MPQHNRSYWIKRQTEAAQKRYETSSEEMMNELKKIYESMSKTMSKEVDEIYFKLLEDEITRTDIWTYKHYRDLSDRMAILAAKVGVEEERILNTQLEIALKEIYKETPIPGASFSLINETVIKQLIVTPWNDKHYSQRIWDNKAKMLERLKKGLTESIVLGKSKDKAVKDIMEKCSVSFNDADRLVRTELMHVINTGQRQRYKDNGYKQIEVIAYEDDRTCEQCSSLDGKIFDIDDDPLPVHTRCRCTTIPVIEW